MNKSVINMATLRCNDDVFEQIKYFWRASNRSKIIFSICFFSESKKSRFSVFMLIILRVSNVLPKVSFHFKCEMY